MPVSAIITARQVDISIWLGIASLIMGYLLGSFPSAYIMAKLRKGIDIRDVDVRNMGAGAVFRQVGIWEGTVVLLADIAKGAGAVLIAWALGLSQLWMLGAGTTALLGHAYPVYIGFRGGQGVASIIGIFLTVSPKAMVVTLLIMGVVLLITRHFFSMVCISAPFLPLFIWIFDGIGWVFYYSLFIIAFVLFRSRHRLRDFRPISPSIKKKPSKSPEES